MTDIKKIMIEDGTIDNFAKACAPGYSICEKRRWGAIVKKNKSKPGGLERVFLKNVVKNGIEILVGRVKVGDCLEIAEKIACYTSKHSTKDYIYLRVLEKSDEEMVCEIIEKKEVSHGVK